MSVEEVVLELPRLDKLRLMELLWTDLSKSSDDVEFPKWHEEALKETEACLSAGTEHVFDWSDAKRLLMEQK
jgi:hypothetical protein